MSPFPSPLKSAAATENGEASPLANDVSLANPPLPSLIATPMLFGMHSKIYATADTEPLTQASVADRRAGVVEFLRYAVTIPEVRVVTTKAVLDWLRKPVPLQ